MAALQIKNCNLKTITKEHLRGFGCLKELILNENKIECLPCDLFAYTQQLEVVSFKDNLIKFIDVEILRSLRQLKVFDLSGNRSIDAKFDLIKRDGVMLPHLEIMITTNCKLRVADVQHFFVHHSYNSPSPSPASALAKEGEDTGVAKLQKKCQEQQALIDKLKDSVSYWMSMSRDFTIYIKEKSFKVHKSIICDKSPLLKRMIAAEPEADNMILQDISLSTFQVITDFMYEKKIFNGDTNLKELYAASIHLEMYDLVKIVSKYIKKTINKDNAYDILIMSNKYNDEHLRIAAFKEFKKLFPNQALSDEIAMQPNAINKIMEAKKAMDEAFASVASSTLF